jgi:hypothetical protein
VQHLLDKQRTQLTDAIPSDNKTSTRCNNNNEDTNYHLHFDKKLKEICVVVVPFASLTIDSQVESKERKERDDHFNGTQIHGCRPQNRPDDVTNPFDFDE